MEEEEMNRNTTEKDLLKAEKERNVTTTEKVQEKPSEENETDQKVQNETEEKLVVNGKNKEMKKVPEEEKLSPERVMKNEKVAEENTEGSAKKKAMCSFFGEHF